ncbi:MAG: hypothetical protein KDC69_01540 [Flavobacteriaceae bacterium]|nr:hypothetical protein [Flavobacteriaceae bacterium]
MKKQLFIYTFLLFSSIASAQLYEIGAFVGGSNAIADIGSEYYINPNALALGGIAKYNFTSRITFRGSLIYTNLLMNDSRSDNEYRKNRGLSHTNKVLEAVAGIEFNFFKYSISKVGYTSTPYIFIEAGAVNYRAYTSFDGVSLTSKRVFRPAIPFGIGFKTRLANNVSIGLETSFRYTFKDDIDGNFNDIPDTVPNHERYDFGNPNSNDWYVFTGLNITYVFGRPDCNCKDRFF